MIDALKIKAMTFSREKKLTHFYSYFKDGMTVLDVGVSTESTKGLPGRNYFLKNFKYDSKYYTGLGIQDFSGMEALYPGKRFVQYPGGEFPFEDRQFDWIFSNAVIEHVGDAKAQLVFLNEMLRVAKDVFFTTPNKYFPVEAHTNTIFLSWNDTLFYWWCKKNKLWIPDQNLYLFSFKRLMRLLKVSNASSYTIRRNRILGLPMTFSVVCSS